LIRNDRCGNKKPFLNRSDLNRISINVEVLTRKNAFIFNDVATHQD
jgi:hypothetical protein